MKTLLLLAGQSKRFWPLAEKSLFPLCGKPLIAHIVERLEKAGCEDITFIGGAHNLADVQALFPNADTIEQESLQLGMRGALLSALPSCGTEDVLIVSANDIVDAAAYHNVIETGKQTERDGAILAQTVQRYFPGGYLSVTDNRITDIVEKPGEGNEPSNLVNIVCHYHKNASVLLDALQAVDESRDDGYEQALASLFKSTSYAPVAYSGLWQAIKYPWHVLAALPHLLSQITTPSIDTSASIHPSAVIQGNVIIGEGVKVLPHATIVGPCTIGTFTVIGNNALVRGSSIGEHCVIGYNTEIKDSVLHSHVWTHSTYIGDSIIGSNVSFGAGTVTGNLRLDEQEIQSLVGDARVGTGLTKLGAIIGNNCRIGIRVAMNPGVKIGSGTFISSGAMVEQDVKENIFARMKEGVLTLSENTTKTPTPQEREKYRK